MKVERVKYVIWAADLMRASGGEGKRTWTGLSFQVADVVAGGQEVAAGGGQLKREPQPEGDEPPHLAMCVDPEGNEFMLTRKR
jgi:lactoylglutathione lyase